MNAETEYQPTLRREENYRQYRSLSMTAVATFSLGLISLASLLFPMLLIVPLIGIGLGIFAVRATSRRREELTGRVLARVGLTLCVTLLVAGTAIATTIYVTEVPEGYQRISFAELQPDKRYPKLPVSPEALQLNGKKVFVKGYVLPGDRRSQLKTFVLVPDMGTCCFGGQPKLTDMIEVTLRDPLRVRFSFRRRGVGGVLRVDTELKEISGLTGVFYQLDADHVK